MKPLNLRVEGNRVTDGKGAFLFTRKPTLEETQKTVRYDPESKPSFSQAKAHAVIAKMFRSPKPKSDFVAIRWPAGTRSEVEKAATSQGRTFSEFVRTAALMAARRQPSAMNEMARAAESLAARSAK